MGYTDGIRPHDWTNGISGHNSESLISGIAEERRARIAKKKPKAKK